ncbi:Listeria-Bacteroides repeat domain [Bacteroidales bacterium Barb6]|nr:Listeria-Bacteroides repeat domain [Bacteroidales bacterium Barb6]
MKRIVLWMVLCLVCVFQAMGANKERSNYRYGDFYYDLYDDGTASVVGLYTISASKSVIEDKVVTDPTGQRRKEYTVTMMADYAFNENKYIKEMTFPKGLKVIPKGAFRGSSIEKITITKGMTSIETNAFRSCSNLRVVSLEGDATSIKDYAFAQCKNLNTVNREKGREISIGDYAFFECGNLHNFSFTDGITSIGVGAFKRCSLAASEVVVPSKIHNLNSEAFAESNLRSVIFDILSTPLIIMKIGVESLGDRAFAGCPSLTSVTIPYSVKKWGLAVFQGCESLQSVIIEERVTTIGEQAFSKCPSLASVTIPSSIRTIEAFAFSSCVKLQDIYVNWADPKVFVLNEENRKTIFLDVPADCRIHIPRGSKVKYGWLPGSDGSNVKWRGFPVVYDYHAVSTGVNDKERGSAIDDHGNEDVDDGAVVTFTAFPNKGYHLAKWTNAKGDSLFADNPHKLVVKSDAIVLAHFAPNLYRVSMSVEGNGSLRLSSGDSAVSVYKGAAQYDYNSKVTAEAVADSEWHLVMWANAKGDTLSTDTVFTFVVKGDTVIKALFALNTYRVKVSAEKNGTVKSDKDLYGYNTNATVEAKADTNYHFEKWTNEKGDIVSVDNPYTFTVKRETALQAHFTINSYHVHLSAEKHGWIPLRSDSLYAYNTQARAEAVADAGYHLAKWTDAAGDSVSSDNPYTFAIKKDTELKAHFALSHYRVSASAKDGTIMLGEDEIYIYGEEAVVEAAPLMGYHFVKWTNAAGDFLSESNPYRFTVRGETVIQAHCLTNNYQVNISAGENGRVLSNGGIYGYHVQVIAEAVADSGYHLAQWTDARGVGVSGSNPYLFPVEGKTELTANFVLNNYRVLLSAGAHGTMKSAGGYYTHGSEVKAETFPDQGYRFLEWTNATGYRISGANPYTFIAIREATLTAWFVRDNGSAESYRVNLSADEGGTIQSGGGVYLPGDTVRIVAKAHEGYHFLKWTKADGKLFSITNPYAFIATGAMELTAVFEKGSLTGFQTPLGAGVNGAYYTDGVLHLVNLEGAVVSVRTIDGRQMLLFTAGGDGDYAAALPAGIYILNAARGKDRFVTKFIVRE